MARPNTAGLSLMISFTVIGLPKAQPRVKAFYNKAIGRARCYTPGTAEAWKSDVAAAAKDRLPQFPLTGPLVVSLSFRFDRPKSHYRTGKRSHELKDSAPNHHTSTPDVDNLAKGVLDALTHICMWKDDGQVIYLSVRKTWVCPSLRQRQGCDVVIEEVT